jgi:TetR/AcrR family transcriptional repressor of mexJK operon
MSDHAPRPAGRPKDLEKREAILEAAGRLFLEHGFERTTMDAIAAAAGVSKLTVYSHFQDKEGLFRALVARKCDQYFEGKDFEHLGTLPPKEALTRLANGFLGLIYHSDVLSLYRLLIGGASQQAPQNRAFYDTGPRPTIESLARLLAGFHARGQLHVEDPERAAEHLLAMLQGCMHQRALLNVEPAPPPARALQEHIEDVVAVFMRAYAPSVAQR